MPATGGEMAWGRLRSIRFRTAGVVVLVAVLPVCFVWGSDRVDRNVGRHMLERVQVAATMGAESVGEGSAPLQGSLDQLSHLHDVRVRVVDSEGVVLQDEGRRASRFSAWISDFFFGTAGSRDLWEYDADLSPLHERPEAVAALGGQSQSDCSESPGGELLVCQSTAMVAGGGQVVHVQESSRRAIRTLYDSRYQLLKLTFFTLAVGMLLATWLSWRLVRPLESLRRQVQHRSTGGGEGTQPVELERNDEFGDLAKSFNALLAHLAAQDKANEAFAADLVHEMKNPLAAIAACADHLESEVDSERMARLVKALRGSNERLSALVLSFLELARAEAGLPDETRASVDLGELVRAVVEGVSIEARWTGVAFHLEGNAHNGSLVVHAARGRLETALQNLVVNAASFAGAKGEVWVRVEQDGDMARIQVVDSGPGIASEELPRVFDRFVTRRSDGSGTGLGLAVSRAVVVAHGGRIQVDSTEGSGAEFTVYLPIESA